MVLVWKVFIFVVSSVVKALTKRDGYSHYIQIFVINQRRYMYTGDYVNSIPVISSSLLLITLSECARSGFISFFEDLFSDYFYQLETMSKRMNVLFSSSEKDRWIYCYTFKTGRIPPNLFRKSFILCLLLEWMPLGILMKCLPSIIHLGKIRSWVISNRRLK